MLTSYKKFNESLQDDNIFDLLNNLKQYSDDLETQTSCIIMKGDKIIAEGFNCLPGKTGKNAARQSRPLKYAYLQHAERNAIAKAAKMGISTNGADLYMEWFPCSECAKSIIDAGIKRLYCTPPTREGREKEDSRYFFNAAEEMLTENGVELLDINKFK